MTMEITPGLIVFSVLALIIVVFSILTVTSRRILRAATYLLFVLFATAGLYFQLDYQFLGAVQLTIYAGGIIVLYVFSILLTQRGGGKDRKTGNEKSGSRPDRRPGRSGHVRIPDLLGQIRPVYRRGC